jgi:hypothetical protein
MLVACLVSQTASGAENVPPPAADTGLAVIDISAVGDVPKGLDQLLNEALLTTLKASGRFSPILSSSDMRGLLDLEQQRSALGCDASNCLVELGGALGVPFLLIPSLGRLGDRYLLQAKILLVEDARVVARAQVSTDQYRQLLDVVERLAEALIAQTFKEAVPTRWRPRMRWTGIGLAAAGAAGSAYGYWRGVQQVAQFQQSVNNTDGLPGQAAVESFQSGIDRADRSVAIGYGAALIGALLWVWGGAG